MLTPLTDRQGLLASLTKVMSMCPQCLRTVHIYARLDNLYNWKLAERCHCGYISYDLDWMFEEEPTMHAVSPRDFEEFGILLHRLPDRVSGDEYWQSVQDEEYDRQVAHGWEDAWHDQFYE